MPGEPPTETAVRRYRCLTEDCDNVFDGRPCLFRGRDILPDRRCQDCQSKREAERRLTGAGLDQRQLEVEWRETCPPLYRDTDPARLPADMLKAAQSWTGAHGLGFAGKPGTGKTRAAYLALRRMHFQGRSCCAITGTELRRLLSEVYARDESERSEARQRVRAIRGCAYLLLDDLGKQRFTEAAEEDVFDLLETRSAQMRPIVWTTNSTAQELAGRLSSDRAGAIIRRLTEFSEILKP